MFFGRISPIKSIETLIKAAKIVLKKNSKVKFFIIGPHEENYLNLLKDLIKKYKNIAEKVENFSFTQLFPNIAN